MTDVKLIPLTRNNWEPFSRLQVYENQRNFIPDNLFIIAESKFEKIELLGIEAVSEPVGMLSLGFWSGVTWISRIMIDKQYQRLGLGKASISEVIHYCRRKQLDFSEIRASISVDNTKAVRVFESSGFKRLNEFYDVEYIMAWHLDENETN